MCIKVWKLFMQFLVLLIFTLLGPSYPISYKH
jgi:hypothetical protein